MQSGRKARKKVKFKRDFFFIYNLKENGNFTLPTPPHQENVQGFQFILDGTRKETHFSKDKRNIHGLSVQSCREDWISLSGDNSFQQSSFGAVVITVVLGKWCLPHIPAQGLDVGMGISFSAASPRDECSSSRVGFLQGCAMERWEIHSPNVDYWICHFFNPYAFILQVYLSPKGGRTL